MFHRANLRRLKALTALVAVAPFAAATIAPETVLGQDAPSASRKAPRGPASGKRAARMKEQPAQNLRGDVGNWTYSSQGGYESRAFPHWRKIKTQSGGPKVMGPRGRAEIMVDYWSPPGPEHGYGGTLTVERTGTAPGSFEAQVFVDGKQVDSFKVEKETKRDLTKMFGSDLGGLATASNLRVTAEIGGTTYHIYEFDLDGAGEVLQKMRLGPDEAWAKNPNPAARRGPSQKKVAVKPVGSPGGKSNAAAKCPPSAMNVINPPKQEDGTLGSWSYDFLGSSVHSELIPEKIRTRGGGNLKGENKKGGLAELKLWYSAPPGPKHGFKAWISVTPVGEYDSFKADLFLNDEPVDSVTFEVETNPKTRRKAKPYAKSWDLRKLLGDDVGRIADIRTVRVTADMDGQTFDIFDADIDGTEELVEKMKTGADSYYAPYAARKACAGKTISGPGDNPEAQEYSDGRGGKKKCFITTACCETVGLADDCFELTALRRFRDRVMAETEEGRRDIGLYYEVAPLVLNEIERRCEGERLRRLYFSHILPCALAAWLGLETLPHRMYRNMMAALISQYRPDRLASMS